MITKVWCLRGGQMVYDFDNGNSVSILWAWGSYSDNHMSIEPRLPIEEAWKKQEWETTRVEVYSMGQDDDGTLSDYLRRKYGDNPAGYVPVADIPAILKRADRNRKDGRAETA